MKLLYEIKIRCIINFTFKFISTWQRVMYLNVHKKRKQNSVIIHPLFHRKCVFTYVAVVTLSYSILLIKLRKPYHDLFCFFFCQFLFYVWKICFEIGIGIWNCCSSKFKTWITTRISMKRMYPSLKIFDIYYINVIENTRLDSIRDNFLNSSW